LLNEIQNFFLSEGLRLLPHRLATARKQSGGLNPGAGGLPLARPTTEPPARPHDDNIYIQSQKNCYVQQRIINQVGLGHIYVAHRECDRSKMVTVFGQVAELPDEHHRPARRKVYCSPHRIRTTPHDSPRNPTDRSLRCAHWSAISIQSASSLAMSVPS
jgi:hypothetical protein